jgi:hypothetical protein
VKFGSGRNVQQLLASGTSADLCIATNVMLYEFNTVKAKEYFQKAWELFSGSGYARERHLTVIANIDVVCKTVPLVTEG